MPATRVLHVRLTDLLAVRFTCKDKEGKPGESLEVPVGRLEANRELMGHLQSGQCPVCKKQAWPDAEIPTMQSSPYWHLTRLLKPNNGQLDIELVVAEPPVPWDSSIRTSKGN